MADETIGRDILDCRKQPFRRMKASGRNNINAYPPDHRLRRHFLQSRPRPRHPHQDRTNWVPAGHERESYVDVLAEIAGNARIGLRGPGSGV